jgi:hypothetical protein
MSMESRGNVTQIGGVALPAALLVALIAAYVLGEPPRARAIPLASHTAVKKFVPEVLGVELHAAAVRPGDALSYTVRFRNSGSESASRRLTVFVHLEREGADCAAIEAQQDHEPRLATEIWRPDQIIADGPRLLTIPPDLAEGEYRLHVGLYDLEGNHERVIEDRTTRIRLDRAAVTSDAWSPDALSELDRVQRAQRVRVASRDAQRLETPDWNFALDADGSWSLSDHRTGQNWSSDPDAHTAAIAIVKRGDVLDEIAIARFDAVCRAGTGIQAEATLDLGADQPRAEIELSYDVTRDGAGVAITWRARNDGGRIVALRVLDHALLALDTQQGALVLPRYLGQVLPADRGLPHDRWYKNNDLSMAMCSAQRADAGLLLTWTGLETLLGTHLEVRDSPLVAGRRLWSLSLDAAIGAAVELRPLAARDLGTLARAYRAVADQRGLRRTWAEKRAVEPRLALLEGAPILRFPCYMRAAPRTRYNPGDAEVIEHAYTFGEVARWAEHLHDDLGIERANLIVSGWGREGYDRGHPDVLPANEECGGDAALAACSRRVGELGYMLTLHDNYHDVYKASPSWSESIVRRDAQGRMCSAGKWAGGQAWRVCPTEQIVFARRNFPAMRATYAPGAIFLDTTLTPALETCHDARHPLTRDGDRDARLALFDLAREQFGVVGLEGGVEWAVPAAHWFEGLLTHKTAHRPGWIVVPLFLMVYGDCIALVPVQIDKVDVDDARKVLDLALYAQMPSFEIGAHLAFAKPARTVPVRASVQELVPVDGERFALRTAWTVDGRVEGDQSLFVHLVQRDTSAHEGIVAQADHLPEKPTSAWRAGDVLVTTTPAIELPREFEGPWEVCVGLHGDQARSGLEGQCATDLRTTIAVLRRTGGRLVLEPAPVAAVGATCFARGDAGWSAGRHPTDRLIKNVTELLGPLHRLVVGRAMTGHFFLTPDGSVERTEFGDVSATVNYGPGDFDQGFVRLPPFGLRIESPTFVAFHATRFGGREYPGGAMFTVQSLDGEPLARSRRVRVFHAFGTGAIALGGEVVDVDGEAVRERNPAPR